MTSLKEKYILISIIIIIFLTLILTVYFAFSQKSPSASDNQLGDNISNPQVATKANFKSYIDPNCSISFSHPQQWESSQTNLPLPLTPISQASFQDTNGKLYFSYVCYNANQYTFDQFVPANTFGPDKTITKGKLTWTVRGTIASTTINDQMIILQLFENANSDLLLQILATVHVNK